MGTCGLMADHLELWTAPDDETPPVDLEPDCAPSVTGNGRRERGPFLTYLSMPWAYGDRESSDRWHKLQCRLGHHDMRGGHTMQVDGDIVFIERQCRWCAAGASATGGF